MAVLSMFYGIIISMYYFDNDRHHSPHIHAKHSSDEAVFCIENGEVLEGDINNKTKKLVRAWIEIHKEELMANWELATNGKNVYQITPLK